VSDQSSLDTLPSQAQGLLQLNDRAQALKSIPRTGWLDRGVPAESVESVGDHSLGVALLAWACARERQAEGMAIDPIRVLLLALIHDLPEADIGDLTPYDLETVPEDEKSEARRAFLEQRHVRDDASSRAKRLAEDAAVNNLTATLPQPLATDMEVLWQEIREGTSVEARFVKQVDRLETYLQSLRYLRDDPNYPMASFQREADATIDDPLLAAIRDEASREVEESSSSGGRRR
jgi:putative hydrolase of HD superfamily